MSDQSLSQMERDDPAVQELVMDLRNTTALNRLNIAEIRALLNKVSEFGFKFVRV